MRRDCYFCHRRTIERLLDKFHLSEERAEEFDREINTFIQKNWRLCNPLLATHIQRIAKSYFGKSDLYYYEKITANQLLLKEYQSWEQLIKRNKNSFHTAAKLAVIGTIIDYGAHSVPQSLQQFIGDKLKEPLAIDQTEELKKEILKASSVLYLGDNAGEIVFDKLFIQQIRHPALTYAVRGAAVLNDVTEKDAQMADMANCCSIISNGSDAPSTLLNLCNESFRRIFNAADLIISKGQGNFEGLMDQHKKKIYFLLMAKCEPIAELLNVSKGSMIIKKNTTAYGI